VDASDYLLRSAGLGGFARWIVVDDLTLHDLMRFVRVPDERGRPGLNLIELEAHASPVTSSARAGPGCVEVDSDMESAPFRAARRIRECCHLRAVAHVLHY